MTELVLPRQREPFGQGVEQPAEPEPTQQHPQVRTDRVRHTGH